MPSSGLKTIPSTSVLESTMAWWLEGNLSSSHGARLGGRTRSQKKQHQEGMVWMKRGRTGPKTLGRAKPLREGKGLPYNPRKGLLSSRSAVSDYLRPHGLQHTRLPCLLSSPAFRVPRPSEFHILLSSASFWIPCLLSLLKLISTESVMPSTHLSSVTPFSSCPHSFPASVHLPVSQMRGLGL